MEKLTILIVDDDKTTTSILNHMLYAYTDKILTASDGLEELKRYQEHHPDIILSDINMPHMNGLEMAEAIRKTDEHVKIAIFTDFENRDILLKAIELGRGEFIMAYIFYADYYAKKAFDKDIYTSTLETALNTPADINPELTLLNTVAHAKAKSMLGEADDYF